MDGAGWDTEMLVAYYCFVNLGWAPSRYDALPSREKRLVTEFALKSMRDQKEAEPSGAGMTMFRLLSTNMRALLRCRPRTG